MKLFTSIISSAILCVSSFAAIAAEYSFDKVHTQILFRISHQGFTNSTGAFTNFDGHFQFDPAAPEKASAMVTIETNSLDFNDQTWFDHMSEPKWFNMEKFPTMTFKSTSVVPGENDQLTLIGDLTLLGKTKPVELDVQLNKIGESFGKNKIGFSATGELNRSDWGMATYIPFIGDKVTLMIEVEGVENTKK